ncbi:hypothetical protein ACQY0O_005569 [Thecaphora frezii]
MGGNGQSAGYQGMEHPTAAVPDVSADPGPVEGEAETAGKGAGSPQEFSEPQGLPPLTDNALTTAVLERVGTLLEAHYAEHHRELSRKLLESVYWTNAKDLHDSEHFDHLQNLSGRYSAERRDWSDRNVAVHWKELVGKKRRFDMHHFRIIFSFAKNDGSTQRTIRVACYDKVLHKWSFLGILQVPADLI